MYKIYCHLFPNGKRYIGITKSTLSKRWNNGKNYATCPLVYHAINKYGWENISHEILEEVFTLEEAEERERYFIKAFDTQNPSYGYNLLPGGDVSNNHATDEMREKLGNGWRGKHRTEEEKQKISQGVKRIFSRSESNGHYGIKVSEDTKKKMSKAHCNRWALDTERREEASVRMKDRMSDPEFKERIVSNLAQYRRKSGEWNMPEEAKQKLSATMKGRFTGSKSPCSKPVLQYTVDGQFVKKWANAGEAERAGIAARSNITKCCRGAAHVKTVGGFVWKFEEQDNKPSTG